MKRSYLIAGGLALVASAWVGSGQIGRGERPVVGQKPPANLSQEEAIPAVRVRMQDAQSHTVEITLRGRTQAERKVDVKAEVHGRIVKLLAEKGDSVKGGQIIARIAGEARPARLAEAKALREQRRMEYKAAQRLAKKGFRAETQLAAAKAALEAAIAAVASARIELANTAVRAPFDGTVSERAVEIGDFVEVGDPIARVVDLDPILVVAQINEREAGRLVPGRLAAARLIDGRTIEGVVSYIAPEADPATRTFRFEVESPNPDGAVPDGVTAGITLPLEQIAAHRISPAILTLRDDGQVGVKILGPGNKVVFEPVRILSEDADGIWVTGLPKRVTLITVGQEYVTEGNRVRPIDEKTLTPFTADGARDATAPPAAGDAS